ncbi:hypothetical protein IQ07DRAFT_593696 [Pyrenochaeta sp. DS3sAY3a]|nr:hypothetical protein IQ07DRAFT_593696 [Pyrenochaeta sp. DS3sAY3a]
MLDRELHGEDIDSALLISSPADPKEPLKTSVLTKALERLTKSTVGLRMSVRINRQLVIAITDKHIRHISEPFNRHDDRSKEADLSVPCAWQSGHRLLKRGISYATDGAFPDMLPPALLNIYEWASNERHRFLQLESAVYNARVETSGSRKRKASCPSSDKSPKWRCTIEGTKTDSVSLEQASSNRVPHTIGEGPWAN